MTVVYMLSLWWSQWPEMCIRDRVEDYGLAPEDVTYRGEGSPLFAGRVK